ncbi:MAG TPA: phosphopentomutase [Firmicutes bacterium]|nr:phosphopentomutase [Bacillota bacterium]
MRVILIVLDSLGVGSLPDAFKYNDEGSNTLKHILEATAGKIKLDNLAKMGLGNILPLKGLGKVKAPTACYGKSAILSPGKDTTTGHWELAGIHLEHEFPLFPEGFLAAVITAFEAKINRKIIGNKAASGTTIIEELGEEHLKTGSPIVYTSADSVFQIAAHEAIVPPDLLYSWCETAREILAGEFAVSRVIARPFNGEPGNFYRTPGRRDYSLPPTGETLLDILTREKKEVLAVGKIYDIFAGRGITQKFKTASNREGLQVTEKLIGESRDGSLIFTNLVDFDTLYGHRNNVWGYAGALEEFDAFLPELKSKLRPDDLLVITADHGCDPTWPGSDHTREYVPVLLEGQKIKAGVDLGTLATLADLGATIADFLGVPFTRAGKSFLKKIIKERARRQ